MASGGPKSSNANNRIKKDLSLKQTKKSSSNVMGVTNQSFSYSANSTHSQK